MQNTVKTNPFVFYLRMLVYVIAQLVIRAVTFAPLACLVVDTLPVWGALLCPALMIFVVLPLRFSFAEAVAFGQQGFSFGKAFSFADYGEKLKQSLLHALHVLKWGLPLAALCGYAYYWYSEVDALTVLKTITAIGEWWTGLCAAVAGFFGAEAVAPAAAMMDGVLVVMGVVALTIVVWMYGAVRNSATRYIWAQANQQDRNVKAEVRRRLRGRRWAQLGVAVINLVLWAPFVGFTLYSLMDAVSSLSSQLMMLVAGSLPKLDLSGEVKPLILSFALLYLPLLPVRRWLTASFAVRERKASASAAAQQ